MGLLQSAPDLQCSIGTDADLANAWKKCNTTLNIWPLPCLSNELKYFNLLTPPYSNQILIKIVLISFQLLYVGYQNINMNIAMFDFTEVDMKTMTKA